MPREQFNLRCMTCKRYNYTSKKNKKLHTQALELSKYCRFCKSYQHHKEHKK